MMKIIRQWILCFPHKIHWLFVALLALVIPWLTRDTPAPGEWYPFSNFPMYSKFEKQAYYVFITDLEDKPVPTFPIFSVWPSHIKKIYDAEIKAIAKQLGKASKKLTAEERRPAGDRVLKQLSEQSRTPEKVREHAGFRLQQVDIFLKDGHIVKEATLVGESR